jgi:hypothetical protein
MKRRTVAFQRHALLEVVDELDDNKELHLYVRIGKFFLVYLGTSLFCVQGGKREIC